MIYVIRHTLDRMNKCRDGFNFPDGVQEINLDSTVLAVSFS